MARNAPSIATMMMAAGLLAVPTLAFGQADGTPGNPPGTAAGRALARATGPPPSPAGAPGNPPGTAVGRALGTTPAAPGATTTMPGATTPGTTMPMATPQLGGAGSVAIERQRMSQVIGSRVYNERNEAIGEVEDVLLRTDAAGPLAVIQVGGFLGIGGRLVSVPLNELRWNAERERIMLPGGTREQLQGRPAFNFEPARRT